MVASEALGAGRCGIPNGFTAWSHVVEHHLARKTAYLNACVQPFDPNDPAQRATVTARRRGYLLGNHFGHNGVMPTATDAEKTQAGKDLSNHIVIWYDSPAVRASPFDEAGAEDASAATARLFYAKSIGIALEATLSPAFVTLPGLTDHVDSATVINSANTLGADVIGDMRVLFTASKIFDDVDAKAKTDADKLSEQILSALKQPPTQATPKATDPPLMAAIRALLAGDLAEQFAAAVDDAEGVDLSIDADPTLSDGAARVVVLLFTLSTLSSMTFTDALAELANQTLQDTLLGGDAMTAEQRAALVERIRVQPYDYAVVAARHGMQLPSGWQWPTWDRIGLYWWRVIVWQHVVGNLLTTRDTADFHAADLLRFSYASKSVGTDGDRDPNVPDYVVTDIELGLRNFKYWWDQTIPGRAGGHDWEQNVDTEMTFWSENHQGLFSSTEFIAGQLWPDAEFAYGVGDGPHTGADHVKWARTRLENWLDWRLKYGFGEWRAPGYYNEDFPALFNLVDLCQDTTLATKAAMLIDHLYFELARFTCGGSFGTTAGRAYWEHKAYGWGQAIGDTIEVLFGTRGDFQGLEGSAVAMCTSSYTVPPVLLAVGQDRAVLDATQPFTDRSRTAPSIDEATQAGITIDDAHIAFWWGAGAYFAHTLDVTKAVVDAHPYLANSAPFTTLYKLGDSTFSAVFEDTLTLTVGLILNAGGVGLSMLLPFPFNLLAGGLGVGGLEMVAESLWHILKDVVAIIGNAIDTLGHWLGLGSDDKPTIPESALHAAYDSLITEFNEGCILARANIITHSIGDAMLSSAVNHQVGQFSFQKHPWQATLGCDAAVWTTAPFSPDAGSVPRAWLEMFKDLAELRPIRAVGDVALSLGVVNDQLVATFGHDGPNYWTGSVSLPFVVQHERALIEIYNLSNLDRTFTDAKTHAWFPRQQFDDVEQVNANGGTWTFGRKGRGYVALFSARKASWVTDGDWANKELMAEGGANIWICHIGNATQFAPADPTGTQDPNELAKEGFSTFCQETQDARLTISGLSSVNQLHASFDIPRAEAPAGATARLEAFHGDLKGRFAGQDLDLDNFPRYENVYLDGGSADWTPHGYTIRHPQTGLFLTHDLDQSTRTFDQPWTAGLTPSAPFTPFPRTAKGRRRFAPIDPGRSLRPSLTRFTK